MSAKVSLDEALTRVDSLIDIPLPDTQPCIEAFNGSIVYQANLNSNFEDKTAFVTGISKYIEEAAMHAELNKLLEQGNEHAIMLYTWRCCSRAIPQVKCNDQPNRITIYDRTVEVLGPHVKKLMQLMKFQNEAIIAFCTEMKRLCHPKKDKEFVSEAYLLTLGKFINMFAVLDELKNMKSSVKNDHSAYRRAAQFRKSESNASLESQNLSMFLATNDVIRSNLKRALDEDKAAAGYEEILIDVIINSVEMYENDLYLLPQEKHMLVKVIGFSLNLLDGEKTNINKSRINIGKIDRIFKKYKVVPLYGDMQITPFIYVEKTRNYDSSKWSHSNATSECLQGKILEQIDRIRIEHTQYISELAKYSNDVAISKDTKRSDDECRNLYNLTLNGLKLLSKWTNTVLELYNWKLLNPTEQKNCPRDAEDYERATKYNYTPQEKFAIIEIISMIKGLQSLMYRLENLLKEAINQTVYSDLQNFVQIQLRDIIRKVVSKGKDLHKTILLAVRNTCADWFDGCEPGDDPALKGKKDDKDGFKIKRPSRCIGPSSTQLYMVRTMLESLVSDRTTPKGKKSLRTHLSDAHIAEIEEFHAKSFYWSYLLNLSDSLQKCCDLSQMWYREFFLEMTMGKKIQFPIEMSMPWILTNHILESKDQSMIEYLFYPLDLYNDAAMNALTVFKKRHLYDEVEAEVNLCFDQFVYKLSEQIYRAYKQTAAGILLEKKFRDDFNKIQSTASQLNNNQQLSNPSSPIHNSSSAAFNNHHSSTSNGAGTHGPTTHRINIPNTSRYEVLLKQKHVQLLGRSINLSRLIAQRITIMIIKNLKMAISKFESSNLTGIIELDTLIRIHQLTHKLLSKHLILDNFDSLLKESDLNVSSTYGRIIVHICLEITSDILPNYCYNNSTKRFVLPKFRLNKETPRAEPPIYQAHDLWGSKAIQIIYQAIHSLYTGFIGQFHFKCMNKYLGYHGIALIINQFLQNIHTTTQTSLVDICTKMNKNMRKQINLPLFEYGSSAIFQLFNDNLQSLIRLEDIQMKLFPLLQTIGNSIVFSLLLEQALSTDEVCDLVHASIFLNWLPKPFCNANENLESKMKKLEQKYSSLQIVKIIDNHGSQKQLQLATDSELLTRERLCCGLSIFEYFLLKIKSFLTDKIWTAGSLLSASNSNIYSSSSPFNSSSNTPTADTSSEFYRIWTAIQFIYCMPKQNEKSVNLIEELYGDGLIWSGLTFISLLNQQQRFEAFDYCYHLLKVNQVDNKNEVVNSIHLDTFISRSRKHQTLNNEIFNILNKYLKSSQQNESTNDIQQQQQQQQNIQYFHPPINHQMML